MYPHYSADSEGYTGVYKGMQGYLRVYKVNKGFQRYILDTL